MAVCDAALNVSGDTFALNLVSGTVPISVTSRRLCVNLCAVTNLLRARPSNCFILRQ